MEIYTTENEQVDALRRFFAENGKALAVGTILGIGALLGWRYWQNHQTATMMAAAEAYQQATDTLVTGSTQGVQAVEQFIQNNSNSYSAFAALRLAKHSAQQGDFAQAQQQLLTAQQQSKEPNLQALINLQLARVQLQQNQLDEALKTLQAVKGEGWQPMMQEVRGDVLLAKGDQQGARDAYKKGIELSNSQTLQAVMRMKLQNLSG
ncbi:YfgM family protein [Serratia microhaemolytica]|uniref:YfgM family protein n=1 Tax=Serratia microhaemolytica TaxID=2675110 RepID=UPI000FDD4B36|nr:YfgM family protein [Serratia microhaemolytica]